MSSIRPSAISTLQRGLSFIRTPDASDIIVFVIHIWWCGGFSGTNTCCDPSQHDPQVIPTGVPSLPMGFYFEGF